MKPRDEFTNYVAELAQAVANGTPRPHRKLSSEAGALLDTFMRSAAQDFRLMAHHDVKLAKSWAFRVLQEVTSLHRYALTPPPEFREWARHLDIFPVVGSRGRAHTEGRVEVARMLDGLDLGGALVHSPKGKRKRRNELVTALQFCLVVDNPPRWVNLSPVERRKLAWLELRRVYGPQWWDNVDVAFWFLPSDVQGWTVADRKAHIRATFGKLSFAS